MISTCFQQLGVEFECHRVLLQQLIYALQKLQKHWRTLIVCMSNTVAVTLECEKSDQNALNIEAISKINMPVRICVRTSTNLFQ
jgi:hypothetical protein